MTSIDSVARYQELTPGSVTDAWINDEMQTNKMYAKQMGIAGVTLCQSHGALFQCQRTSQIRELGPYEYTRNKIDGITTMIPVARLTGLSLVFCSLPPQQNTVLPEKY